MCRYCILTQSKTINTNKGRQKPKPCTVWSVCVRVSAELKSALSMIQCSAIFIVGNLFIYVVDAGLDYFCSIIYMCENAITRYEPCMNTLEYTQTQTHSFASTHAHTVSNRMLYGTNSQAGYFQCIAPSNVGVCYFKKKRENHKIVWWRIYKAYDRISTVCISARISSLFFVVVIVVVVVVVGDTLLYSRAQ